MIFYDFHHFPTHPLWGHKLYQTSRNFRQKLKIFKKSNNFRHIFLRIIDFCNLEMHSGALDRRNIAHVQNVQSA